MTRAARARPATLIGALLLDAALVTVFAAIGRASHAEDILAGLWITPVWAITVAGGMLLRWVSGQGVQPAFVAVASLVLLALLVGWRVVAALVARVRR